MCTTAMPTMVGITGRIIEDQYAAQARRTPNECAGNTGLPTDDSDQTGWLSGRLNMAKIDIKGTSATVYAENDMDFICLREQ